MTPLRQLICLTLIVLASAAQPSIADGLPGAPSTIVASQGGAIVTLEDLDAFAAGIPEAQRAGFFNSPTRIENLVTQLLVQKQLAAEARSSGLDKKPLVQTQVALAVDDSLAKARMAQFRDDLKVPDFDELAQEEFIAHKEAYVVRGEIDVEHVLIDTKTRTEAEAKAIAEKVEKEARADPADFEALIEKYSDDASKTSNKGMMLDAGNDKKYLDAFAEAARALKKPGEISPVIQTSYGFHVLKLVKRTEDKVPSFAEAKPAIVAKLRTQYIDKQVQGHTDALRNQPIDANADLVASLRKRYVPEQSADATPAK